MPELQLEPPRPGVPRRASAPLLSTSSKEALPSPPARDVLADVPLGPAVAASAALVLAITSRGDIVVLAALLAAAAATRVRAIGCALACTAALVRWGSSSLGAIAGAQAVLGPAGWTGGGAAVASAWLAALALLAAVPAWPVVRSDGRARWIAAVLGCSPFAIAAADVSVGSAPGGALLARVVTSFLAIAIAIAVTRTMSDRRRARTRSIAAVVLGAVAVVLAGVSG